MKTVQPIAISLAHYFRPVNVCSICRQADARTSCGSRYCYDCWVSINDDLIAQAVEQEVL